MNSQVVVIPLTDIPQITSRMHHGTILPGQQQFDEDRWRDDTLEECHFDDRLWGWACRVSEELWIRGTNCPDDIVLHNLFQMVVHDWSGENHCNDQNIQAMCHSTVMASCLYQMVHQGELNVCVCELTTSSKADQYSSSTTPLSTAPMSPCGLFKRSGVKLWRKSRQSRTRSWM